MIEWNNYSGHGLGKRAKLYVREEFNKLNLETIDSIAYENQSDFSVKSSYGNVYKIKVKSIRFPKSKSKYVYMRKSSFDATDDKLFLALVVITENYARIYLIPANDWLYGSELLKGYDYGNGRKSKPEWGVFIGKGKEKMNILKNYELEEMISRLN